MPILRSIPSKKIINGIEVKTSEVALISESNYTTTGEYAIVIKTVEHCDLLLDSKTTDHIVVKALTKVTIRPDKSKIDENIANVYNPSSSTQDTLDMDGNSLDIDGNSDSEPRLLKMKKRKILS